MEEMQTFDFVFIYHLMHKSLGITYDLSQALQRKSQDVVNAMCLVGIAKSQLQKLRDGGWVLLFQEVCTFCEKHEIEIPNMESVRHCTRRVRTDVTYLHYYRVDIFYAVIDMQLQEFNGRFMETTTELLMCMSCLDLNNSFSAFNIDKLLKLAQFYLSDFSEWELSILENQLENYRLDMHSNSDFLEVKGMDELSQKLVEKKKHIVYPLIYKLSSLALILSVDTASVEMTFSAMNVVKEASRNRMEDQWLNDCLVT
jgi:hAT family C-terminal dimerisation region